MVQRWREARRGGLGGEELLKPQSGADMAGAAIGVVVLFLAAAPFGANANTDSNDGEWVLLLLVGSIISILEAYVSLPHVKKRCNFFVFSLVCAAVKGCGRCVLVLVAFPSRSRQFISIAEAWVFLFIFFWGGGGVAQLRSIKHEFWSFGLYKWLISEISV